MFDTHCHLTYPGLIDRLDVVLAGAAERDVDGLITIGTTVADSSRALALAEADVKPSVRVFSTAGVHPGHAHEVTDLDAMSAGLSDLLGRDRCVALGECGMDFHYGREHEARQREVFAAQLRLVVNLPEVPIVIHNREATDDTLAMLRTSGINPDRFVFHCFTGSTDELDAILGFGAMVSLTGIVTFKSARALAEATDAIPIERLMIETDSPYLTPEPNRKVRPNEPCYVADVARFLAARRGMSLEVFTTIADANAERFFRLPAQSPA